MTRNPGSDTPPDSSDVTICASMAHKDKWLAVAETLRGRGLRVATPDITEHVAWSSLSPDEIARQKGFFVRKHLAQIARSKAVLVCNYTKNEIAHYIGGNTFLEMGAAFIHGLPIYVLNALPDLSYTEEMLALEPIVIHGDLSKIAVTI